VNVRHITVWGAVLALHAALTFGGEDTPCLRGYLTDDDAVTEVPVTVQFRDAAYNAPWLLQALNVAMSLTSTGEPAEIVATQVANNELKVTACFARRVPAGTAMALNIGTREIKVVSRPSAWRTLSRQDIVSNSGLSLDRSAQRVHYGRSPLIVADNLPTPNWLVFVDTRIDRTAKGEARLTVQLYNPGPESSAGGAVRATFELPRGQRCGSPATSPPSTYEVEVALGSKADALEAHGAEPAFPAELLRRNAQFVLEDCSRPNAVIIDLGPTGPLRSGMTTIRYRLKVEASATAFLRSRLAAKPTPLHETALATLDDFVSWPTLSVFVANAQPSSRSPQTTRLPH